MHAVQWVPGLSFEGELLCMQHMHSGYLGCFLKESCCACRAVGT